MQTMICARMINAQYVVLSYIKGPGWHFPEPAAVKKHLSTHDDKDSKITTDISTKGDNAYLEIFHNLDI